jgi:hypothetical protein
MVWKIRKCGHEEWKEKMDLTGLEFSVGVFMNSDGGKVKPRRRR